MKDPFLSRRRKPNTPKKLKLVCSFNGTFQRRPPPSGNLRYTGGETRILTVDRNIGFLGLVSKLSDRLLVRCPINGLSLCFSFKYQLPVEDYDTPLVLITSDGDVSCMIDEYEKLESLGKPTRLWIYVFNDNGFVYRNDKFRNTENVDNGSRVFFENNYEFGFDFVNGYGCENWKLTGGTEFDCNKVMKSVMGVNGAGVISDDSLTKVVLGQQLLAKEPGRIRGFHSGLGVAVDQSEIKLTGEKTKHSQISLPRCPPSHETTEFKFGCNPYRENVLDYDFRNANFQRCEDSGINRNLLPVSRSHPLNPRDGNPRVEPTGFTTSLTNSSGPISSNQVCSQFVTLCQKHSCGSNTDVMESLCILDRESITLLPANCNLVNTHLPPLPCRDQLVGCNSLWARLHGGIRNHGVPPTDLRSQRSWSYIMRNHRNSLTEMGNHRNVRLDGRAWVGKFYPGLRSSSSISKQGQAMRLFCPRSGYHLHTLDYGLNGQAHLFHQPCADKENFTKKGGHGVPQLQMRNPKQCQLASNVSCSGKGVQSLLPPIIANKLMTSTRATDPQEDLLTGSIGEKLEVPCQDFPIVLSIQSSCLAFEKESQFMEPMETINVFGSSDTLSLRNGVESGCESEFSGIGSRVKLSSKHRNSANAVQGGLASLVDLSLHNLSLSSSKEVEPAAHTSPPSNDVSEAFLKPQSKPVDLMVEEHLSSGPRLEIADGVSSDSSLSNAAKLEEVDEQKEEMQQDHPSNSSIDKKADIRESYKCSKGNGSIPIDLAIFYTHLASRELQTIKHSDLEYIKELGSGTYGTVFHGKWKGCDVAIKKLKPICFTEGAPDQDRLVADFWKEAHILGQLHHPHIMAFYGVVTDGPVINLAAVTEYMVNGSLKQVLRRKDRTIDRRKRLIIAMDAAFGMEYLHEKNIVHFDLKSHNLLVNMRDPQRPVCKIGDLGLSKIMKRTLVSGGVQGTIPWMAPELFPSKKNMVTEKVDVYSFGVVMWELLTGEEPYGNMRAEEIIAGIIKGDLRPEIPSWCDPVWKSLMERCWSSVPDSRPAFSEIAKELRAMSAGMNIK